MAALQTLPASLVNKIKMFDGKSEEAIFQDMMTEKDSAH